MYLQLDLLVANSVLGKVDRVPEVVLSKVGVLLNNGYTWSLDVQVLQILVAWV